MKNIFKETDVLLREYGAAQLTGNDLLLYEHNKKSCFVCFLYWCAGFGMHRFYMGDKFSKIYGCYFLITELTYIILLLGSWWERLPDSVHDIIFYIVSILWILDFLELFLFIPLIKYHNLILKQKIIEKHEVVKDRGPYRVQEAFSIIAFVISFVVFELLGPIFSLKTF